MVNPRVSVARWFFKYFADISGYLWTSRTNGNAIRRPCLRMPFEYTSYVVVARATDKLPTRYRSLNPLRIAMINQYDDDN